MTFAGEAGVAMREPYAAQREARTMIGVGLTMEGIGPNAVRRGYGTGPHATTRRRPKCNMLQHVVACNLQQATDNKPDRSELPCGVSAAESSQYPA